MSQPPALKVPTDGDRNQGPTVEVVTWAFTSIALDHRWDDFWIIIAMCFNLIYAILVVIAVENGNGRHPYYLEPHQLSNAIRWNSIAFIPGILAFSVPKLGVAILLIRLLSPGKAQRVFIYFLSITCIILSCICAAMLWQQCNPPEILWNPAAKGKCWKPSVLINYSTFVGAFSASTDIYLAAYPLTVLYNLSISTKKKIGLSAVLSLGFVAGILAIYKCTRLQGLYDHSDYTYSTVDLLIWTSIESSFIMVAADLPTLRPIFQLIAGRQPSQARSRERRASSYKLHSVSKDSGARMKKAPREQYPTDTVDLVGPESVERILPPNQIRNTFDVQVDHHDREQRDEEQGVGGYKIGEV